MNLDVGILITAIGGLVGILTAVVRVAWNERGARLDESRALTEECRKERTSTIEQLLVASKSQTDGVSALTTVVEGTLREMLNEEARRRSDRG